MIPMITYCLLVERELPLVRRSECCPRSRQGQSVSIAYSSLVLPTFHARGSVQRGTEMYVRDTKYCVFVSLLLLQM